jgi:DNA-binding NarL/FixJ family response regulator
MQNEAIWIIDSDTEDHDLVHQVFQELNIGNELVFLKNAEETMNLLSKVDSGPFIIICDINLPRIDGFQLRQNILSYNSKKYRSVPFIFWSTYASEEQITHAYDISAHGFFIKETSFDELKATFTKILKYWMKCKLPKKSD